MRLFILNLVIATAKCAEYFRNIGMAQRLATVIY